MAQIDQLRRKINCEKKNRDRIKPNLCDDVMFKTNKNRDEKDFVSKKYASFLLAVLLVNTVVA